jgi:FAD/FMN-containing dehydrogenase
MQTKQKTQIFSGQSEVLHSLTYLTKGGGCNFGVITEFTFKVFYHPEPFWHAQLIFKPEQWEDIHAAFGLFNKGADDKSVAVTIFAASLPPDNKPAIVVSGFYDGTEQDAQRNFKPLIDVGPIFEKSGFHPFLDIVFLMILCLLLEFFIGCKAHD